jgi:hypothetical protein
MADIAFIRPNGSDTTYSRIADSGRYERVTQTKNMFQASTFSAHTFRSWTFRGFATTPGSELFSRPADSTIVYIRP